jgi:histone arginine demethylase JMJD6
MTIDRLENLSYQEFERDYLMPLRPVIVTDAMRGWPALGKWTPEFFRDHYGTLPICVDGRSMTLGEMIELVLVSTPEQPAPYLRNQLLSKLPRELRADVTPLPIYTLPNWLESPLLGRHRSLSSFEIYIGGHGARFPTLHYDGLHSHAFLMEIYGRKEFWCYSPEQAPLMYPRDGIGRNQSKVNDVEHPDLERFPLFATAVCEKFVLAPGEMLFVPAGWWHTTRLLGPAISVSISCANATNWKEFARDYGVGLGGKYGRLVGLAATSYLNVLGWVL